MQTSFRFEAIGTHWQIDIDTFLSSQKQQEVFEKITHRIIAFDKMYSRFRKNSLVTKISQKKGVYQLPYDAEPLLSLYNDLYTRTEGAFTPLIGDVLVEAGYDAQYSLHPRTLHAPAAWEDVLTYNAPYLTVKKPVLLDVGAAGKGYLIDIISGILEAEGICSYTIDGGGDILYKNPQEKPLRVGLEHPENPQQVIGIANITNQSICCSAGNRRKWGKFHHIINPHTLTSPKHILSTWVIADTALVADAIATCLFFVPAQQLMSRYTYCYAIVYADYSLEASEGFLGEFFLKGIS